MITIIIVLDISIYLGNAWWSSWTAMHAWLPHMIWTLIAEKTDSVVPTNINKQSAGCNFWNFSASFWKELEENAAIAGPWKPEYNGEIT